MCGQEKILHVDVCAGEVMWAGEQGVERSCGLGNRGWRGHVGWGTGGGEVMWAGKQGMERSCGLGNRGWRGHVGWGTGGQWRRNRSGRPGHGLTNLGPELIKYSYDH